MLSPEYYDQCADVILEQYAELENAVISSIIKKLMKHGYMTESAKHQAEMIQESGLLCSDIINLISQRTDSTFNQVKALFEDSGVKTVEIDNEVYRKAGKVPVDIRQSDSMKQILEAGFRKTFGEMWNLTKTLAVTTQQEYIKACNNAYMQVSSGASSYQEAIRNAVKSAAVGGLTVKYPSGNEAKLDVAIRRSVLTGVSQTCSEIGKMNAEANGCHLMEITAHSGARPGHVIWQGQLVTLTGEDAHKIIDGMYVYTLYEIGYGDVTGFKGANCRHDWLPYEPGISKPNYTKKELEELNARNIEYKGKMYTEYEISQKQRYRERHIRELKRQTLKAQTAMDNATDSLTKAKMQSEYQYTAMKLKRAESKLQDFCNITRQDRDRFREQVNGFGRSEAQRAVHAAKKYNESKSSSKSNMDYMSRFNPSYSNYKNIKTGTIQMQVKKVSNSKFNMYTDTSATRKDKAVRLAEKSFREIQKTLPKGFKMPDIAVVNFDNINPYAIGGYDKNTGILYINNKYNTKEKILDFVNKSKDQFANKTEYAPFLHELGHKHYEDSIKKIAIAKNMSYNEIKNKIDRKIYNYVEKSGGDFFLKTQLSVYAQSGYSKNSFTEIVAECFSVRNNNLVAKEILNLLE